MGDDRGNLASGLGLNQIISEFDDLGYSIMIVVDSEAGGGEYLSTSTIVGELDGPLLVYLRSVAC